MNRKMSCLNCGKEFVRSKESDYGGEAICPHCLTVHDMCFETVGGIFVDGWQAPKAVEEKGTK